MSQKKKNPFLPLKGIDQDTERFVSLPEGVTIKKPKKKSQS